jgi:hypothetical protein
MKYLKIFEDFFPYKHEMTDEEFQMVWQYFCFYVFPEERVTLINQIILDSIREINFLEFSEKIKGRDFTLRPYFGLKYSKESGTYMGLSYEFQREVNNKTYNIESCKGWDHVFKDAMNLIQPKREMEHGLPYYEYGFHLTLVDKWENKSIEELDIILKRNQWSEITKHLSKIIESMGLYNDINLSCSVKVHHGYTLIPRSHKFEVRLVDLDFEPKSDSEIWN